MILRYGGIFNDHFIANIRMSETGKHLENWSIFDKSYEVPKLTGLIFMDPPCIV